MIQIFMKCQDLTRLIKNHNEKENSKNVRIQNTIINHRKKSPFLESNREGHSLWITITRGNQK